MKKVFLLLLSLVVTKAFAQTNAQDPAIVAQLARPNLTLRYYERIPEGPNPNKLIVYSVRYFSGTSPAGEVLYYRFGTDPLKPFPISNDFASEPDCNNTRFIQDYSFENIAVVYACKIMAKVGGPKYVTSQLYSFFPRENVFIPISRNIHGGATQYESTLWDSHLTVSAVKNNKILKLSSVFTNSGGDIVTEETPIPPNELGAGQELYSSEISISVPLKGAATLRSNSWKRIYGPFAGEPRTSRMASWAFLSGNAEVLVFTHARINALGQKEKGRLMVFDKKKGEAEYVEPQELKLTVLSAMEPEAISYNGKILVFSVTEFGYGLEGKFTTFYRYHRESKELVTLFKLNRENARNHPFTLTNLGTLFTSAGCDLDGSGSPFEKCLLLMEHNSTQWKDISAQIRPTGRSAAEIRSLTFDETRGNSDLGITFDKLMIDPKTPDRQLVTAQMNVNLIREKFRSGLQIELPPFSFVQSGRIALIMPKYLFPEEVRTKKITPLYEVKIVEISGKRATATMTITQPKRSIKTKKLKNGIYSVQYRVTVPFKPNSSTSKWSPAQVHSIF